MAAPTVAAISSGTNDSVSYAVTVPAGTVNGDLLIAVQASDWGTFAGNDIPAAFTPLAVSRYDAGTNAFHIALGARIANNEPASYLFSHDAGANVGAILRVTGHDVTPVIAQVAPSVVGTGTTAPSIVPNATDDLLITIHGAEKSGSGARTWTPPPGMIEQLDLQSTIWTTLLIASLQNPSNPSGTEIATPSAAVDTGAACTISIKAAVASGGNVAETLADIQMRKLPALVGFSGSLNDMLRAYYKLNAQPPVAATPNLSTRDYERSMYLQVSGGSPTLSISDLESLYCAVKSPATVGSLSDRQYVIWRDVL